MPRLHRRLRAIPRRDDPARHAFPPALYAPNLPPTGAEAAAGFAAWAQANPQTANELAVDGPAAGSSPPIPARTPARRGTRWRRRTQYAQDGPASRRPGPRSGGCSGDSMTPGGRDVLIGGAGGALAGAAIGSFTANAGVGALIGAGVGVVGGYLQGTSTRSPNARQPNGASSSSTPPISVACRPANGNAPRTEGDGCNGAGFATPPDVPCQWQGPPGQSRPPGKARAPGIETMDAKICS